MTKRPRTGVVRTFDEDRGLGTVVADDGTEYPFHCTALTDGTRRVDVGAAVVFELAGGHGGRLEARAMSTVAS
ncbi:MAG: cold-shock protein [Acidimicrobiales bacterium]